MDSFLEMQEVDPHGKNVDNSQSMKEFQKIELIASNAAGGPHFGFQRSGVYLTWKDLWVTIYNGKDASNAILKGLSGYASPGQVLAIMGPSGCGKSTLLDALAGNTKYFNTFFRFSVQL